MNTLAANTCRWIENEPEPMPVAAGVLAVAVHIAFAAMLLLNMSWQNRIQPYAPVKLWESMPTTLSKSARRSEPRPAPTKPAARPEPVAKQAEPMATPPADIAPPSPAVPEPPRADLAAPLREQPDQPPPVPVEQAAVEPPPAMKPLPLQEQPAPKPEVDIEELKRERALALAALLREEETARLDDTLDRERQARIVEYKERLEERERKLAEELGEIRDAAQQRRNEQQAQAASEAAAREATEDYRARISAKIRQRVILPPDMQGNPEAIYSVALLPGGKVTDVRLLQTSGVATYDAAVERAILAAQPLPVPEDPRLFQASFKNLLLNFRPKE